MKDVLIQQIPLKNNRMLEMRLPIDITKEEAEKAAKLIMVISGIIDVKELQKDNKQ